MEVDDDAEDPSSETDGNPPTREKADPRLCDLDADP